MTLWTVVCQAPLSWDSPGKNTGVRCHFLLQGILPTREQTFNSYVSCTGRRLYHYRNLGSPSLTHTALKRLFFCPKLFDSGTYAFYLICIYIIVTPQETEPYLWLLEGLLRRCESSVSWWGDRGTGGSSPGKHRLAQVLLEVAFSPIQKPADASKGPS